MPEKFDSPNRNDESEADKEAWEDLMGNELEQFLNDIEATGDISWLSDVAEGRDDFERLNNISKKLEKAREDNAEFLEKSGLGIDLRKSHYKSRIERREDDNEEKNGSQELIVNVVDRERFVEYLKSFGKDQRLDEKEVRSLDKLASVLSVQVPDYYELDKSDDDFLTLATTFKELASEYDRFSKMPGGEGLRDWAELFSEYSNATSGRYMKELLEIKELELEYSLNSSVNKFHKIYDTEKYKKVWDDIVSTIEKCAKNKNAHEFLRELLQHINSSLSAVQEELETKEEKIEYIPLIKNVQKKLGGIELH